MEYKLPGDATSKDEIKLLVSEVEKQESKGVHLLVNNAGIAQDDRSKYSNGKLDIKSAQSISEHLWKADPSGWAATFETNITAQFFVAAGFLPLLVKAGENTPGFSPSIFNITSISGVMKGSSNGQFAYATSKTGLIHLMRMMQQYSLRPRSWLTRKSCIQREVSFDQRCLVCICSHKCREYSGPTCMQLTA